MTITYLHGDATRPDSSEGPAIIAHICNDIGKWGRGFVMAVSNRWPEPEETYRKAFASKAKPELGDVQFVPVQNNVTIANIIGQHGIRLPKTPKKEPPIRYEAVRAGLRKVAEYAQSTRSSVHMPRIGCGLAGGRWEMIEPLIKENLLSKNINVNVYDL
jgi:O-acetyl-ADP-ribose deacetylase (regulator of RNase III)